DQNARPQSWINLKVGGQNGRKRLYRREGLLGRSIRKHSGAWVTKTESRKLSPQSRRFVRKRSGRRCVGRWEALCRAMGGAVSGDGRRGSSESGFSVALDYVDRLSII